MRIGLRKRGHVCAKMVSVMCENRDGEMRVSV